MYHAESPLFANPGHHIQARAEAAVADDIGKVDDSNHWQVTFQALAVTRLAPDIPCARVVESHKEYSAGSVLVLQTYVVVAAIGDESMDMQDTCSVCRFTSTFGTIAHGTETQRSCRNCCGFVA